MHRTKPAPFAVSALLLCSLVLSASGCGRGLAGNWVIERGKLDNGEPDNEILALSQNGQHLACMQHIHGFAWKLDGVRGGNHFQLFSRWHKDPWIEGDIVGDQLHLVEDHQAATAFPARPQDLPENVQPVALPPFRKLPYNGLAKTPPMGWNSWNLFESKVDDNLVRAMADAMVASGMRDLGYRYINIDDTWQGLRDSSGNIRPNRKFPDMKALADYVHSKGLKLGIYSSPGPRTCEGYPGSYGHEMQDARTYAAWGVDYLKYDWCSAASIYGEDQLPIVYQKMGEALLAAGHPIVYSVCEYGRADVQKWAPDAGANLWRTTGDVRADWSSILANLDGQAGTAAYGGPGHWNDPDMLEVGNGDLTADEQRTHISLWALSSAPLLAGNDLRNMSSETRAILANREVIAIDQDPLGRQATFTKDGDLERWVKPLTGGAWAVGVVNLASHPSVATVSLRDFGKVSFGRARDVWRHRIVEFRNGTYSLELPPHGILLLRLK
jgi:alpha-galactosidase